MEKKRVAKIYIIILNIKKKSLLALFKIRLQTQIYFENFGS